METSKFEKRKSFKEILKALNYHDEREAAVDLTILSASARYADFSEECQRFEKIYGTEYREFEKKILGKKMMLWPGSLQKRGLNSGLRNSRN